jgi:hypothetical protein
MRSDPPHPRTTLGGAPGVAAGAAPTSPERLLWSARLRAASAEVDEVARALRRRADGAGLAGPAGDALAGLVDDVAAHIGTVARDCADAADVLASEPAEGLA